MFTIAELANKAETIYKTHPDYSMPKCIGIALGRAKEVDPAIRHNWHDLFSRVATELGRRGQEERRVKMGKLRGFTNPNITT